MKFHICDNPYCRCADKVLEGRNGTVTSALGRYIVVDFEEALEEVMTRRVHFVKANAAAHLERIDRPAPRAKQRSKAEEVMA